MKALAKACDGGVKNWPQMLLHSSDWIYANGTYDQTSSGNAYGNHNYMDGTTMEGRVESGRTTNSLDTIARRKTGRCSGSCAPTIRSEILEQTLIR